MVQLVQSQGMLFTTKHAMYQVKVCFRDLLVFWAFSSSLSAPIRQQPVHLT